jgi:hypothetical protein
VWKAGDLPELSMAELLTVLIVGFDLSFTPHAPQRAFEIVPLKQVAIQREYRLPGQLPDAQALLRQELPAAVARIQGHTMVVDARVEDHERLAELLSRRSLPRRSWPRKSESTQVYTLRVQEQPVGAILRQLAERIGWTIEMDEASIQANCLMPCSLPLA